MVHRDWELESRRYLAGQYLGKECEHRNCRFTFEPTHVCAPLHFRIDASALTRAVRVLLLRTRICPSLEDALVAHHAQSGPDRAHLISSNISRPNQ